MNIRIEHQKKRILYVEANEDGTIGGSYFSLQLLVKSLDKKKYETTVLLYDDIPLARKMFKDISNLIIVKKPAYRTNDTCFKIITPLLTIKRKLVNFIYRSFIPFFYKIYILVTNRIDLIHLNNTVNAGWDWLLIAKLLRRPCIVHQRGPANIDNKNIHIIKRFDRIICISDSIKKTLDNDRLRTVVIYNPINVSEYTSKVSRSISDVREEFHVDNEAPLIGMVGNFQEWKGQVVIVNAVDLLRRVYPDIICLLIGAISNNQKDKEYYNRVVSLITEKKLQRNVVITGFREDIPNLVNALDVQIHCSIEPEPFGRVLLEGMSLMKPIISTNIGGPSEIIENEVSGLLITPNRYDLLSEKIHYLLQNKYIRKKIGMNALERVKDKFSLEKFKEEINELYSGLL